jgi:DNA-binding beta-propeller fold protein YncE
VVVASIALDQLADGLFLSARRCRLLFSAMRLPIALALAFALSARFAIAGVAGVKQGQQAPLTGPKNPRIPQRDKEPPPPPFPPNITEPELEPFNLDHLDVTCKDPNITAAVVFVSGSNAYIWLLSGTPPAGAPAISSGVYAVDPNTENVVASIPIAGSNALAIAAGHTGAYVYATVQGFAGAPGVPANPPELDVISTSSFSVVETIDLPQGANPGRPASSPDDRYIYVPSDGSLQGVLVVDTQNPSSVTTIPATATLPVNTSVITPDGELLFVMEGSSTGSVYAIDTTTGQKIARMAVPLQQGEFETLADIVIDPTGSQLYLAGSAGVGPLNQYTGYLTAFDTATLTSTASTVLNQGMYVNSMAISQDGSYVIVNDEFSTAAYAVSTPTFAVVQQNFPAPPNTCSPDFYILALVP